MWAAVTAAVAVWLLSPPRPRRLPSTAPPGWAAPVRRWVAGREGGMETRLRTLVTVPAAVTGSLVLIVLGGPVWVVLPVTVVAAGIWVAMGWIESDAHRARRESVAAGLPQVCDLLACCLQAGQPLRGAVRVVASVCDGPIAEDLGRVVDLVRVGECEASAWRELGQRPEWRRLALDLARSVDTGSEVADAIRHHAELAREDAHQKRETDARAAGVRSVLPLTVCFLPAFFLVGIVPIIAGLIADLFW